MLQERLSLSTKLFLKEWLAAGRRASLQMVRVPWSFMRHVADHFQLPLISRRFEFEPPPPPAIDYTVPAGQMLKGPPPASQIRTSIVIPVFNKAAYTASCLRSLLGEIDFSATEIIVVDNGSTDETQKVLSHFTSFVRVIKNDDNRGFVDACNQGAAGARGKYLVFLNNDTEVLPGWLDNLVDTIKGDPLAGAVGSMFLYPDGSIQEAGAIVWKNGEAHHYGWGGLPDDKRFNFAREVDYCSAASLLIKKEIFQRLGGFDRRFAPAYYEDVDLCFGVRSLGYKVIYQPMSRLVHYEGVTAGRDTTQGVKHFQILNREKFVEKWRHVLERGHLEKDLKRLEEAAHRLQPTSIIVFDERIPSPDRDAGSARMLMILKILLKWSQVIFVPFNRPQGIEYEQALWKEGIETASVEDYRRLLKYRNVQAAILSRPSVAEALIHRVRRIDNELKIVFDMVDAHFIRLEREYEITGDENAAKESQRYRKLETRLAGASDLVWCNSSNDKRVMEREVLGRRIEVIPTIHELHDSGKPFDKRENLLFIGNLAHKPNSDAVNFFMREIYPLVRECLPDVKLYIVGDNPSAEISAYNSEQVRITGYVPHIEPLWRGCRVFIAPLRFGAGVKGKVGEAMSYGLPVVTTSIGAEGFALTHGLNAMIADKPRDFAQATFQLYSRKDFWQSLAQNSRSHIEKNFTPEVIAETINDSIKEPIHQ